MKGGTMKKYIIISLIMAVMLLVGSSSAIAQTQSSASGVRPTFLAPTPGIYVNGWPAFTLSYPKNWVQQTPGSPGETFRVADSASKTLPRVPNLVISMMPSPLPIDNWSKILVPFFNTVVGRDVKILYDKPSQLKDGIPTQEAEFEWVRNDGLKFNNLVLTTRKDNLLIFIIVASDKGKVGEDLKDYAYSLTFQRSREEPVKVPSDVREFLDKYCSDIVSGNAERIVANYSDQFSHNKMNKGIMEQWFRNDRFSPIQRGVTLSEATVTFFETRGDKAYLDGFYSSRGGTDPKPLKLPMGGQQIIKQNGRWMWYGNQK
jgi:hypothetical protein